MLLSFLRLRPGVRLGSSANVDTRSPILEYPHLGHDRWIRDGPKCFDVNVGLTTRELFVIAYLSIAGGVSICLDTLGKLELSRGETPSER